MSEPFTAQRRISPILLAILVIALLLSVFSVFQGVDLMLARGNFEEGSFYLTLGATTLALSMYVLFQTRKRIMKLALKAQPVTSTILCEKCGLKNVRDFQRGDFVFKEADPCPKCNENMVIAEIYREVKDTKKTGTTLG